jgi:hypothetical protein
MVSYRCLLKFLASPQDKSEPSKINTELAKEIPPISA